ncbi:uncharacterized protein LOC130693595, partial [Daphnia carinata]|uniref:uncharacterized protein LOC130693595 n=1 Tax=Daphnia carinata TaxID=120202 RepID=UPI002868A72E
MPVPFLLGSVPTNLKSIQEYLDVAADYEATDVSVSYWSMTYALQQGFSLVKDKEDLEFLLDLMEWLGGRKEELKSLKTVCDLVEAQLHVENVADNLLTWAESGFQLLPINRFNKIVGGAFLIAKILLDVCSIFGELTNEMAKKKKYVSLHTVDMKNCTTLSCTETMPNVLSTLKHKSDPHPVISEINDLNTDTKKLYDRIFLLNLRNQPSSMKQPLGFLTQEVLRIGHSEAPKMRYLDYDSLVIRKRSEDDIRKRQNSANSNTQKENRLTNVPDSPVNVALKKFIELLNELNPSTWKKLLPMIKASRINSAKRLSEITNLIFDKAIENPNLLSVYAKLCRVLWFRKVPCASSPSGTLYFRTMMLARVLKEFEKAKTNTIGAKTEKEEIKKAETVQSNSIDDPQENQRINSIFKETKKGELEKNGRKDTFANIKFIAELFKVKLVAIHVINECIVWLLSQNEDESALECLCSVLVAIGKELETPNERPTANPKYSEAISSYYHTLEAILDKNVISDRVRALVRDVIDMRNSGWLSRHENSLIKIEQDPNESEEQGLITDLSFEKPSNFIDDLSHKGNILQNGEGVEHTKQEIGQILETLEAYHKPAASVEADETSCSLLQEAATLSGIEILFDDRETRGGELNGGHKRQNDTASLEAMKTCGDVSCESPTEKLSTNAFQQRLKQYFQEENKSTTDEICIWIQKEYVGEIDSTFIRALMTCIIETSIEGNL